MNEQLDHSLTDKSTRKLFAVFLISWVGLFLLYLPAARAGFAGDYFKDWLQVIQRESFYDYINRPGTSTLYQFTQFITYIIYKAIGSSRTGWHIIHITFQALSCTLLFQFSFKLLNDVAIRFANARSIVISVLFATTPYNSEIVVHEPCLHYIFGFLMLLMPLIWLQQYFETGKRRLLLYGVLLYLPASFSLEVFYFTPCVLLIFAVYLHYILKKPTGSFKTVVFYAIVPMVAIFLLHMLLVRLTTHAMLPHEVKGSLPDLLLLYNEKVLKYLFDVLLLVRFWPYDLKTPVYHFLERPWTGGLFHLLLLSFLLFIWSRKSSVKLKLAGVLAIVTLLFIALVSPREFPQMQLVVLDRYHYFALPFTYLTVAVMLPLKRPKLVVPAVIIFCFLNLYCLYRVNNYWRESNQIVEHLLDSFPFHAGKAILLLNPPENFEGVPMIGSNRPSAFKTAYNTKHERQITDEVYDVASFNMTSGDDGAHVSVINDSLIKVTLNQWGTWWWFHYIGATSMENEAYRLDMKDAGHWYEVTLKRPAETFTILFFNKGDWHEVDMSKKDMDQY